jgi:hypothetical protein
MFDPFQHIAGDFNQDDVADAKDLILFNMSYGRSGFRLAADGNEDGLVDGADFLAWQQTLGEKSNLGPSSVVPEPNAEALILGVIGVLSVISRRAVFA